MRAERTLPAVGILAGLSGLLLMTAAPAQTDKVKPPVKADPVSGKSTGVARYVDAEGKMSFLPPAGWQRSKELPPPTIAYVAPGAQKATVYIGLVSEPVGNETMEQFVKSNRAYAAQTKGLTIYDTDSATLAGEKAMTWRMHVRPPKGQTHETRQIFCIHNKRSYVITLAGLPSNIQKYDAVFDKVVASFQWEK